MNRVEAADYHDIVRVADPRFEPGGDRVAFLRLEPEDEESVESTVYLTSADGGEPRRFTVSEGADSEPRWHPEGESLAFTSTRGADDDTQQLWLLPTDGGEAEQVTQVVGGVSGIEWSPDGSRICFTQLVSEDDREEGRDLEVDSEYEPEPPDPRVVDRMIYRSMQRYADGRRHHVYVLDVESGELEALTEGDRDYVAPTWGDDDTIYYATKQGEEPDDSVTWDVVEHDLKTDSATPVAETTGWASTLAATADGRIAFPRTPEPVSLRQTEIVVHDRSTGDEVTVTGSLDRTLGNAGSFRWGPDETELYFTTPDEGSIVLWTVPGDGSEEPRRALDEGVSLSGFDVTADRLAFTASDWDHPGDVFLADREDGSVTRLTDCNAEYFDGRTVAEPEELWFESEQGPVQGWLLLPPEDVDAPNRTGDSESHPLVVEIHGGPHAMWTTSGTMWHEFQTLAARGYAVFWSNPRGSVGYGEDFATAIEGDWGDVTLTDVLAGVDEVCERPEIDETQLFVTGGSFGGYMTAWTVGHTDRFTAAVSQRGVYDLTSFYGSTDAFKLIEGDFGVTPWEDPEFLWERSPVAYVPEVTTPTLVLHSDRDFRTPANTAELFYLGLKKYEVDTRMVRYPREGHELSRSGEPAHVVDRIERIARWFDGYSEYHDAPPALERDPNDGLTAGTSDDENEDDER